MNETRVNLQHLLEDIRDSYTSPLEEIILTELVANALDSKATRVDFDVDVVNKFIRCTDNGNGMKRGAIKNYHNIAASTKTRGSGIGFAGVGAKLSLLIASQVITESKGGYGSHCATTWQLTGPYRAPWKFITFSDKINSPRGTSVAIHFADSQSHLLKIDFVRESILKHFYPLLNQKIMRDLLKYFYKKPIEFYVNGQPIAVPENSQDELLHWFSIRQGKARAPIGVGYLTKTQNPLNWLEKVLGKNDRLTSLRPGLYISTFGKVIKGGWEWLGILPKNNETLAGIVEIPALAEILTTNKNDFLSDATSLKKYYKYRKAIQEAVLPILESLGESREKSEVAPEKIIKPLNKTIDQALNNLVDDFPELESLMGSRAKRVLGKSDRKKSELELRSGENRQDQTNPDNGPESGKNEKNEVLPKGTGKSEAKNLVKARQTGIQIVLGEINDTPSQALGRIIDDTLTINIKHPAWQKAKTSGFQEYHILLTVAVILSEFLEMQKSPQEFINRFLASWAEQGKKAEGKLF
ncbi:MAG: ATP-binding protein [Candidatus Doudnabacteria bacterium]|nr:ATP-binding protein [Candidatus Doudnabacteria bacterium]